MLIYEKYPSEVRNLKAMFLVNLASIDKKHTKDQKIEFLLKKKA